MKRVYLEGLAQGVIFDQCQLDVPRIKETLLFPKDIFGEKQRNLGRGKRFNMIKKTGLKCADV
jgi:hypothetical protein